MAEAAFSKAAWLLHLHEVSSSEAESHGSLVQRGILGPTVDAGTVVMLRRLACSSYEEAQRRAAKLANLRVNLSHPHVLGFYGACLTSDSPVLVYEYGARGNFAQFFGDGANRSLFWTLFAQACAGLLYLQAKKTAHGSLKCSKILVGADGKAKVAGIGWASIHRDSKVCMASFLRWMAPELMRGEVKGPTFSAGIYSLAMCMLEAWSGDVPWGMDTNLEDIAKAVCAGRIPPRPESMSDQGWQLIQKMAHTSPSCRPTLSQVFDEIQELIDAETWVCSDCKRVVSRSDNYCGSCGAQVVTPKEQAIIDLKVPAKIKMNEQTRARVFGSDGARHSRLIRLQGRNSC